jgi:hypothetical protein
MSDSNVEVNQPEGDVNVNAVENTTPPEEQAPVEVSDGDTGAAEEKQG